MKSLFLYDNYRELLQDLVYGPEGTRGVQAQLAKAMGCQASYLLQVMKGKAALTEDQGLKLARHLKYSDIETDYLILILRMSRAASSELSQYLEEKRKTMYQQSLELQSKVKSKEVLSSHEFLGRYFGSWMPSTIHMATSSKHYQTAEAIAARFNIEASYVEETLQFLLQANLVVKEGKTYRYSTESIYLPRKSALNEAHQSGRRVQVLKSIAKANPEDIHFSSIFTLDKKDLETVKKIFTEAIEKSHTKIQASGSEEVYSICLDIFSVV
jgi:uncharacterized protein (TIGR02147 family)